MKVSVAKYNGRGASAQIETEGEWGDTITIAEGVTYSAKKACLLAAERLRRAADRFDRLALEPDPFHIDTHRRLNR